MSNGCQLDPVNCNISQFFLCQTSIFVLLISQCFFFTIVNLCVRRFSLALLLLLALLVIHTSACAGLSRRFTAIPLLLLLLHLRRSSRRGNWALVRRRLLGGGGLGGGRGLLGGGGRLLLLSLAPQEVRDHVVLAKLAWGFLSFVKVVEHL